MSWCDASPGSSFHYSFPAFPGCSAAILCPPPHDITTVSSHCRWSLQEQTHFVMPLSPSQRRLPFAFVYVFSCGFPLSAPLKASQTAIRASLFSSSNVFDAFDGRVFVWFLFTRDWRFFPLLVCRTSANKNTRKGRVVKSRSRVRVRWEGGRDVWCVSAAKLLSPPPRMRTKTCCRISLSTYGLKRRLVVPVNTTLTGSELLSQPASYLCSFRHHNSGRYIVPPLSHCYTAYWTYCKVC